MSSVLFLNGNSVNYQINESEPLSFKDLNLDQFIEFINLSRDFYNLKPYYYSVLPSINDVLFRHEVFKDLENNELFENIKKFSSKMQKIRKNLEMKEIYSSKYMKERWHLDTVELYCLVVEKLNDKLKLSKISSQGLSSFLAGLSVYCESSAFLQMKSEALKLKEELGKLKFTINIHETTISVSKYEENLEVSSELEKLFERFRNNTSEDYLVEKSEIRHPNHIESQILENLGTLYPVLFENLILFCDKYKDFINPELKLFDREIQFYISYLEYINSLKEIGLSFCYPELQETHEKAFLYEGFDITLAKVLCSHGNPVISNSFKLQNDESFFIVTGSNQGGKTTFAKMYGQVHFLGALGCPVPGQKATLCLIDSVYTHFGLQERVREMTGKLEEDLSRLYTIVDKISPRSVVVLNELFSSTTAYDAFFLSKRLLPLIREKQAAGVFVTFLDELADEAEWIVSMVAGVDQDDPTKKTFRLERKPADGQAYAETLASKYQLSYEDILKRIK